MTRFVGERPAPLRVAIVDDEPFVRVGLRRFCSSAGLDAVAYGSGSELLDALDAPSAIPPDVLVLDAHMPDMTGLDVQHELERREVAFPTIVYSADEEPEARERLLNAGAADYLCKPVDGETLLATIALAVATRANGRNATRR